MYVVASIGFFLFSIRSTFFWTDIWQKNDYTVSGILTSFQKYSKERKVFYITFLSIFLFFAACYGIVIFNDRFAFWYHLSVTILFVLGGLFFVREILGRSIVQPVFTIRTFVISFSNIGTIALFYTIPLIDSYVWMVILTLMVPFLIAGIVAFVAFPAEIYTDFVTQKALEKLQNNTNLFSIALVGYQTNITKKYLYEILSTSYVVVKASDDIGVLGIMQSIAKKIDEKSNVFIFDIPFKNKKIKSIFSFIKPKIVIIADLEENKTKNKKELLIEYHNFLRTGTRHIQILSFSQNVLFNQFAQKKHKNLLIYGTQKAMKKKKVALYYFDMKIKRQGISWKAKVQKQILIFRNVAIKEEEIVPLLPVFFIAQNLKISVRKIQNTFHNSLQNS